MQRSKTRPVQPADSLEFERYIYEVPFDVYNSTHGSRPGFQVDPSFWHSGPTRAP